MSSKMLFIILSVIVLLAGFMAWQLFAHKVKEPAFVLVNRDGNIELRQYPEMVVASVSVSGERYAAINQGFRILADYIFGNNQGKKEIAMTAPVVQRGEKIAMTAPVMQSGDTAMWTVEFVMPAGSTLVDLPKPTNAAIKLIAVPARLMAVIRFSGSNSDANLQAHLSQLMTYIQAKKIAVIGAPVFAFYNPPWILPIFRRNEIMVEVNVKR